MRPKYQLKTEDADISENILNNCYTIYGINRYWKLFINYIFNFIIEKKITETYDDIQKLNQ